MSKYLIVGGGGFIGSWLAKDLTYVGHEVMIIDPFYKASTIDDDQFDDLVDWRKNKLLNKSEILERDYLSLSYEEVENIYRSHNFDAVIHLAANPIESDDWRTKNYQITKDIELTWRVANDAKNYKVDKFVYMSSLFAYGPIENFACTESQSFNPKTAYGISKYTGELIVKSLFENYNIIRSTSVYGYGDANLRATQIITERVLAGKDFWVNKDADLDFIYIKDLVRGIKWATQSDCKGEDFHISGGKLSSLIDYVDTLFEILGKSGEYEIRSIPDDRPQRGMMTNAKAEKMLEWVPIYDLNEGIKDYLSYLQSEK